MSEAARRPARDVSSLLLVRGPDALQLFRKRHPDLPVSIRSLHSAEIARAIALQEGDVGIVYGSLPHPALPVLTRPILGGRPGRARLRRRQGRWPRG